MNSLGKFEIVEKVYSSLTEVILAQNFGSKHCLHFFDIHSVFQPRWVKYVIVSNSEKLSVCDSSH